MRKHSTAALVMTILAGATLSPDRVLASGDGLKGSHGSDACTSSESWAFSGAVFESKRDEFLSSIHGHLSPVRGFSEAFAMRRFASNPEMKWLGEYWISARAL